MIYEAFVVGFKEGFKVGLVWLVLYAYLNNNGKNHLIRPFYLGITSIAILSLLSISFPSACITKENLGNIIAASFAVLLISSGFALFHASGVRLFGSLSGIWINEKVIQVIIFIGTLLFFFSDSMGTLVFLQDLSLMKEALLGTFVSSASGLIAALVFFLVVFDRLRPLWIGSFFNVPQLLLFLAMVKLLGGGIKGFAELSLIPAVQRGFMKFAHDLIHQMFVLLMIPDHMLLRTTLWNFIGFFFGPKFSSIVSLLILLVLPMMFIRHSFFNPLPAPEAANPAYKRKIVALLMSDRRKKALPIIVFIILIVFAWFSQGGESVTQLYNPKPKPVIADKGIIMIPVKDPTMDLMDGRLHKFSLTEQGEEIRLIIIRKPDNTISVCLDACEICAPEGYGQQGDHVICIFCNTPIPVRTMGEPGGCNPIPLTAATDEQFVKIELDEILRKWQFVKTGKSKEGIK